MMGDVIENPGGERARLHIAYAGTGPTETVSVFNGTDEIFCHRPYENCPDGRRIKIIWAGAEVRGRARMSTWDGELIVTGNTILNAVPVNFWNPEKPLEQPDPNQLRWKSVTTGGASGIILELERPHAGIIDLQTAQGNVQVSVAELAPAPLRRDFGGLEKRIEISRLPDANPHTAITTETPLTNLHPGDNPVYVRVTQENGHIAWASPVYVGG